MNMHDGLDMEESEICERLSKWRIAQNPELEKYDVTEFNQDDFKLLEKTLQIFIQYIRFHDISIDNGYYPYIGIANGLQIEDYEVFQRNPDQKERIDMALQRENKEDINAIIETFK
ncbi:19427_t:CDS:2, partial [Racocetra fulgida]